MAIKTLPAAERLRFLFSYDPETGILSWNRIKRSGVHRKDRAAGTTNRRGYLVVGIDLSTYLVHRIIWKWVYGVDPIGYIDHINFDRSDNRLSNLREATPTQSSVHVPHKSRLHTPFRGVSYRPNRNASKPWQAQITFRRRPCWLGYHSTAVEAALAYDRKAIELYGEFAVTNAEMLAQGEWPEPTTTK